MLIRINISKNGKPSMQKSKDIEYDWEDLRYIYHIAKAGSIAAGARQLNVNHSTVFRRLNQFEKRCGINVFIRSNNGYTLSSDGLDIMAYLEKAETNIQAINLKLMGKDKLLQGEIRISVPGITIEQQVLDWIHGFHELHPDVHFRVDSTVMDADLNRREADIAVRATMNPPEHLVGSELFRMPWRIVASRSLLDKYSTPSSFHEALALPWVGFSRQQPEGLNDFYKKHLANKTYTISVDSLEAIRHAVSKGLGLGLLPTETITDDIVAMTFPEVNLQSGLWLLTHPDLIHASRISTFMAYVREVTRGTSS